MKGANLKPNLLRIAKNKNNKQVKREVDRAVRRALRSEAEEKYLSTNTTSVPVNVSASGYLLPVSQIASGTSNSQRVGFKVRLSMLELRARIVPLTASTATVARLIVFAWRELATATEPAIQDLMYETTGQDYLTSLSPIDPRTAPSRAIIFHDELITHSTNWQAPWIVDRKISMRDLEQVYTGTTFSTHAVYVLFIGQAAAANQPITIDTMLHYFDS